MKEETELGPPVNHCPICTQELPISEFGICRARKDGRNLYCKSCIRNKVTQSRRALKEYKSVRKRGIAQHIEMTEQISDNASACQYALRSTSKLSPVDRVREAIRK